VIANGATSSSTGWPVGFWWSELTHPHYISSEAGWDAMSDPDDETQWQAEVRDRSAHEPQRGQNPDDGFWPR
jgi:hypothetical protein